MGFFFLFVCFFVFVLRKIKLFGDIAGTEQAAGLRVQRAEISLRRAS